MKPIRSGESKMLNILIAEAEELEFGKIAHHHCEKWSTVYAGGQRIVFPAARFAVNTSSTLERSKEQLCAEIAGETE
jgi:hypothetical protein